jgi:tungstate transport system permease protein
MDFISTGIIKAFHLLMNGDPETWSAIGASLTVSSYSMAISLALGIPMGFILGYVDFPGKKQVRTGVDTLLALPTVFIGLMVYALLSRQGPLGNLNLLFTLPGIALGQAILALPIVTALCATAVEGMDYPLRATLLSLGANRRQLIFSSLWEVRYGILTAVITAYGRVLTEVGISMMVGGNIKWYTRTITTAIALETNKGQFATGIALGIVLLLIALCASVLLSLFRKR